MKKVLNTSVIIATIERDELGAVVTAFARKGEYITVELVNYKWLHPYKATIDYVIIGNELHEIFGSRKNELLFYFK